MPNAERIAELQRLAYGAGATDAERRAALEELEAIRHGRFGESAEVAVRVRAAAGAEHGEAGPPPWNRVRSVAVTGVLALAIGYGAGWLGTAPPSDAASPPAGASGAEPTDPPATPPPDSFVDVADIRAVEVFEREPTTAELAFDPILFSGFDVDDAGPRLLATRSDGVSVWAVRTVEGDLCVVMRIDEFSSGGGCTSRGLFPVAEGVGIETYHATLGNHSAFLDQWGDLRMRVEGVSGGPRT